MVSTKLCTILTSALPKTALPKTALPKTALPKTLKLFSVHNVWLMTAKHSAKRKVHKNAYFSLI